MAKLFNKSETKRCDDVSEDNIALRNIAKYFNFYKIKYNELYELFNDNIDFDGYHVNLFINLDCILNRLSNDFYKSTLLSLTEKEQTVISSDILNIVAHYRRFLYTRFNLCCTAYIYTLDSMPFIGSHIYADYYTNIVEKRLDPHKKEFYKIIDKNLKGINAICDVLNGTYFLRNNELEPSLIPYYFIHKDDKNSLNIIISDDVYDYQLIDNPNTYVLNVHSKEMITRDNIFDYILRKRKYKCNLPYHYYKYMLPYMKNSKRNVTHPSGDLKVTTIKKIQCYYDTYGKLLETSTMPEYMFSMLNKYVTDDDYYEDIFDMINLNKLHNQLDEYDINLLEYQIYDKYDNTLLNKLNYNLFGMYPLEIEDLIRGTI